MEKVVEFKEKRWFQGKHMGQERKAGIIGRKRKKREERNEENGVADFGVDLGSAYDGAGGACGGTYGRRRPRKARRRRFPGSAHGGSGPRRSGGSRVLGEVTENREEEEKHFRMEDGSFVGVNYGVPVHYAQGEEWKDIDNTLVIQENGMRTAAQEEGTEAPRYVAVNGEESRGFAGNLGSGFLFSANTGEEGMEFSLVSPEEEETVPATEAETVPETEAATEGAIIPETEAATEVATIPEREAATEGATDPETEGATEAATIPETEAATEGATAPETATEAATVPGDRGRGAGSASGGGNGLGGSGAGGPDGGAGG